MDVVVKISEPIRGSWSVRSREVVQLAGYAARVPVSGVPVAAMKGGTTMNLTSTTPTLPYQRRPLDC